MSIVLRLRSPGLKADTQTPSLPTGTYMQAVTPGDSDMHTDAQGHRVTPRDMAIKTNSRQPCRQDEELLVSRGPHRHMQRWRHL